jgi:hypothetical protein
MAILDMQLVMRTKASVERTETYRLARRVARSVSKHDIVGLSAELAFRALLAINRLMSDELDLPEEMER